MIEKLQLNHHKYRYIFLSIDFDLEVFSKTLTIEPSQNVIIIQYDGIHKPELIYSTEFVY